MQYLCIRCVYFRVSIGSRVDITANAKPDNKPLAVWYPESIVYGWANLSLSVPEIDFRIHLRIHVKIQLLGF